VLTAITERLLCFSELHPLAAHSKDVRCCCPATFDAAQPHVVPAAFAPQAEWQDQQADMRTDTSTHSCRLVETGLMDMCRVHIRPLATGRSHIS
jgi:hypothetical protein